MPIQVDTATTASRRTPCGASDVEVRDDADADRNEQQRQVREQQLGGGADRLAHGGQRKRGEQQHHAEDRPRKRQREGAVEDFAERLEQQQDGEAAQAAHAPPSRVRRWPPRAAASRAPRSKAAGRRARRRASARAPRSLGWRTRSREKRSSMSILILRFGRIAHEDRDVVEQQLCEGRGTRDQAQVALHAGRAAEGGRVVDDAIDRQTGLSATAPWHPAAGPPRKGTRYGARSRRSTPR